MKTTNLAKGHRVCKAIVIKQKIFHQIHKRESVIEKFCGMEILRATIIVNEAPFF
jgi:hypothetical protein